MSRLQHSTNGWNPGNRIAACCLTPVLIALVILFGSGPVFAASYERGLEAFRGGDHQEALDQWQPLADAGNANAQYAIGMMHEYGRGLARDDVQATEWYRKAAEQGVAEAQYRLGVFHENGWGVARDVDLAAQWYARAAQLDHTFAQHDLAYMYLSGSGVPADKVEAYKWLKIASVQRADLMAKHLRSVAQTMTSGEIARAEELAEAWLSAQKI